MTLVRSVTTFDDSPGVQARSLGVLPWCVKPCGDVAILLGREACIQSRRWAPFEGSAKPGETCEQGAAREFVEESLGLVKFSEPCAIQGTFMRVPQAAKALEHGAYSHRVQLRYPIRQRSSNVKEATTLLARVLYDPALEARFMTIRMQLTELSRFSKSLHKLRLRVESSSSLYGRGVNVGERQLRVLDVLHMSAFKKGPNGGVSFEASVRCVDPMAPERRRYTHLHLQLSYTTCLYSIIYFVHLAIFRSLLGAPNGVLRQILHHPAVQLLWDEHGEIDGLRVNTDYLEKDRVRYWSRDDLSEMMDARGHFSGGLFRSSSCALVETCLKNWEQWFMPTKLTD
jgi:hypothetical protein